MRSDSTSYFYHRNNGYDVTIAYKRVDDWCRVIYGASFCHPNDQFSKAIGRKIAEGRMSAYAYSLDCGPDVGRFGIHEKILDTLETEYDHSPSQFSQ